MTQRSSFQRFTSELRRRHVPQTVAIYLVAAWAAIEFADVIVPNLNGPAWVVTAVIVAAGVGFPVVVILAWLFDWGPEGLHRTGSDDATGTVGATGPPGAGTGPEPSAPWMMALGVLVVGIGSALVVAALLSGGESTTEPEPPELRPPPGVEGIEGLEALEGLEDVRLFEDMDTMNVGELVDVARSIAEEAGLSVLVQQPQEWRIGRREPTPLASGENLTIEGVARDTAGVVSVVLDGDTIVRTDDPREVLRFTGQIVGTGSEGIRDITLVVHTANGRRVSRTFQVEQRPARQGSRQ